MIILGLDIATTTGFAWYDANVQSLSSIKTGLMKAEGESPEEKAASLADQLRIMLKDQRPDFVSIEEPLRNVKTFTKTIQTLHGPRKIQTINPNQMLLPGLIGGAVGIISAYRIPWQTIPSSTWRRFFFGPGFKPPIKIKEKEGEDPVEEKLWKRAAIDRCHVLRITVKNADAAEAVGIAMAGKACQRFKSLQTRAA
ncbi:MAG TPA: hypothetical protein VNS34_10560 [Rhizobiaceae bacterium]|nr:hypothetical protein [Rhizobiaceae bacterium]